MMDIRGPFEIGLGHCVHSNCDGYGFMVETGKGDKPWRTFNDQYPAEVFHMMKYLKLILVDRIDGLDGKVRV